MATRILPLELIDKAIGSQIWILMRGTKEIVGTLRGFDDYVSVVSRRYTLYDMDCQKRM
jgi:U6 snRNA-associated Sm-like protein LSm5